MPSLNVGEYSKFKIQIGFQERKEIKETWEKKKWKQGKKIQKLTREAWTSKLGCSIGFHLK